MKNVMNILVKLQEEDSETEDEDILLALGKMAQFFQKVHVFSLSLFQTIKHGSTKESFGVFLWSVFLKIQKLKNEDQEEFKVFLDMINSQLEEFIQFIEVLTAQEHNQNIQNLNHK